MSRASASRPGRKVGVTLFIRENQQSIWENGIFQNCFFLLMTLARVPGVDKVFIVNGGPGDPAAAQDFLALAPAPVIDLATAAQELDVVIEMSAQLDPHWAAAFRGRGGRVIAMRVANDYIIDIERMMFDLSPGLLMSGTDYDAIWTLPAFRDSCADYYRVGWNAPVRLMQHLWSPILIERSLREKGREFAYVPGRRRWRVAIVEPNICSVKSCHLPMLVADAAHRLAPRAIEHLRVYGTQTLRNQANFVDFARSLDLTRQGLASFENRFAIYDIMQNADAIVSHHWHNAQNYVYYEALWGGFPLIHNSHLLGGCGYRYRDFDSEDGALALLEALRSHDADLPGYRARAAALLDRLNPVGGANIAAYGLALEEACQ